MERLGKIYSCFNLKQHIHQTTHPSLSFKNLLNLGMLLWAKDSGLKLRTNTRTRSTCFSARWVFWFGRRRIEFRRNRLYLAFTFFLFYIYYTHYQRHTSLNYPTQIPNIGMERTKPKPSPLSKVPMSFSQPGSPTSPTSPTSPIATEKGVMQTLGAMSKRQVNSNRNRIIFSDSYASVEFLPNCRICINDLERVVYSFKFRISNCCCFVVRLNL